MAAWFPHGINGNPVLPGGYAVVGELCACKRLQSSPGLPTVQFLITYSIQKQKRKAWSILSSKQTERRRGLQPKECTLQKCSLS